MADARFVSKSTVSRFCRCIGFADFNAVVQSIRNVQMRDYKRFDEYLDLSPQEMTDATSTRPNRLLPINRPLSISPAIHNPPAAHPIVPLPNNPALPGARTRGPGKACQKGTRHV